MAAFCPIMQFHSEYTPPGAPSKDRTPWNIQANSGDDRVIPTYRFFARLRMNLLPYLVSEAAYATAQGEPLMRPLLLDFSDDPVVWRLDDQYCLGRDLLVAPVVEEGATSRRLYLPHGRWCDFWTGAEVDGNQWLETPVALDRIPVFVRAGAVVPLNLGADGELGQDVGVSLDAPVLALQIYPGDAQAGEIVLADNSRLRWRTAQRDAGRLQVILSPAPVAIRLVVPGGAVRMVVPSEQEQTIQLSIITP
jgi:alpha-glucosidase (family GH31 glycosyl hydrolase)